MPRVGNFRGPMQAVVGAVIGFAGVSLFFLVLYLICSCGKKRKKNTSVISRSLAPDFGSATYFDSSLHRISMPDLISATNNFDSSGVVGDGGFGLVYKAHLADGRLVAVKKLDPDCFQGLREFEAEMETLGRVQHKNIVKILGYCKAGTDRVLIYDYVANGSLDQWLYSESAEHFPAKLTWSIRVQIIKGVAAGLAFLHDCCQPRIIHRDIKSSNVLLDENFAAHIADFGLARQIRLSYSHVSTQAAGTMGYMPPEYKAGSVATMKGDVYSFGVLMLELATRRRPNLAVEENFEDGRVKLVWLVNWARQLIEEGREMDGIDQFLREDATESNVKEYFKIASSCTKDSARERPLMRDVAVMLDHL